MKRIGRILLVSLILLVMLVQCVKASERVDREVQCLALNVYHEARGEPLPGRFAVAYVTLERAKAKRRSICRTVFEPHQFSWTSGDHRAHDVRAWRDAVLVAKAAWLHDTIGIKPPYRATHFHADYVSPAWSKRMTHVDTIGRHRFYREHLAHRT
jgi:N-acetylmuramoyl-L-alanine amidase